MSELERAEETFRAAQEKLKSFLQEHAEFGIGGLEFVAVNESKRSRLAREYSLLKAEHDRLGAEWAASLERQVVQCVR